MVIDAALQLLLLISSITLCSTVINFDSTELFHLFGISAKKDVPIYWIDEPNIQVTDSGLLYAVKISDELFKFRLKENDEIFSPGFHSVEKYGDVERAHKFEPIYVYIGESITHSNTSIALVKSGNSSRGIIISDTGHYLIHPAIRSRTQQHIIHKRSVTTRRKHADDSYIYSDYMNSLFASFPRATTLFGVNDLTIELGVFVDDALWVYFTELYEELADVELQRYVLSIVNNIGALFGHSSMEPKIRIKIIRYEVMKKIPPQLNKRYHYSGEVDHLLEIFCKYQRTLNANDDSNPSHWDHALLLSGYDLYRPGMHAIAGYAPVNMMCSYDRSCTINEGLDFGSVFVIAHEIGHSLGMSHDGDNGCDPNCCVMSRSIGSGKTAWSKCSVRELNYFVSRLGKNNRPRNCLLDGSTRYAKSIAVLPGQQFTLNEQCVLFHGICWKHELKDGQNMSDVCEIIWCGNGEGIVRTAHPALEGTYCGKQKWCIEGKCVGALDYPLRVVDGGWSDWNDYPYGNCQSGCVECSIQGQIRIRRSNRQCSNPYPNNGGKDCVGDSFRGLLCDNEVCKGPTPNEYATKRCTELGKSKPELADELSGIGYQYEEAMCKVWCLVWKDRVRTIENFPDGTPCGPNKYCVRGECRTLGCNGRVVVDTEADCPPYANHSPYVTKRQPIANVITSATANTIILDNISNEPGLSFWSSWEPCQVHQCGEFGYRRRIRPCFPDECRGFIEQKQRCYVACTSEQNDVVTATGLQWSEWSSCSTSCGFGNEVRFRRCLNCDPKMETRECYTTCDNDWNKWGEWSSCSRTCGVSRRLRKRTCRVSSCSGSDVNFEECDVPPCSSTKHSHYYPLQYTLSQWSDWGQWSRCTVSCGTGMTQSRRICMLPGECRGSAVRIAKCDMPPCQPEMGSLTEWIA